MAIPAGVICLWPGTAASIPDGWERVTALDSKFLKSVPNNSTDPGSTGGTATHDHTTQNHQHTINHGHTNGGNSNNATSFTYGRTTGTTVDCAPTTHLHTLPEWISATIQSSNANPTTDAISNDPANLVVIWIQSLGTAEGIPNGALAFFNSASLPTSWTLYTNGKNRFLKGAAAAGDGGGTNAGNAAHTHSVAHDHTSAHTHAAATSGQASGVAAPRRAGTAGAGHQHTHSVSGDNGNFGTSNSENLTTVGGTVEPPWYKLAVIVNGTGGDSYPIGIIAAWIGTLANIPDGWLLCDGNNGTPNLLDKFIKGIDNTGELGNTGGAAGHGHTANAHNHSWASTSHVHATTWGAAAQVGELSGTSNAYSIIGHASEHAVNSGSGTVSSVGNATPTVDTRADTQPPFYAVAYIQVQNIIGILGGSSDGATDAQGTINGIGILNGLIAGAAAIVGTLAGTGTISSLAEGASTAQAAFPALPSEMSGLAEGISAAQAQIIGLGSLATTAEGQATVTGILIASGTLSGLSQGSSTGEAIFTGEVGALRAISEGIATAAGILAGFGILSGLAENIATGNAILEGIGALAGQITGQGTASVEIIGSGALAASSAGLGIAEAQITSIGALSALSEGISTVEGVFIAAGELIGEVTGAATVEAQLIGFGTLSGISEGTSTGSAIFTGEIGALSGAADGISTGTADILGITWQYLYPDGDLTYSGSWKNELESSENLYQSIDEHDIPDDDDYVWNDDAASDDYFEVALENPSFEIEAGGATIFWRAGKASSTASTIKAELRENETVIASDQRELTESPITYALVLTSEEKANIIDWNDLRMRFVII